MRTPQLILRGCAAILAIALASCRDGNGFEPPPRDLGENAPRAASIGGVVRDLVTQLPIAGVLVEAEGLATLSGGDGSYELRDVQNLVVVLVATKEGYQTARTQLPVAQGRNDRTISLQPLDTPKSLAAARD